MVAGKRGCVTDRGKEGRGKDAVDSVLAQVLLQSVRPFLRFKKALNNDQSDITFFYLGGCFFFPISKIKKSKI